VAHEGDGESQSSHKFVCVLLHVLEQIIVCNYVHNIGMGGLNFIPLQTRKTLKIPTFFRKDTRATQTISLKARLGAGMTVYEDHWLTIF
jgi:hypothetical protein